MSKDHRKMIRTKTPGIYKRGSRYVVVYKVNGQQRKESARTLAEARKLKAARQADIARGEFFEASRVPFAEYATEWVERYNGRGRGFRESTRENYRRDLARSLHYFGERRRLAELTPRDLSNFVAWLCDEKAQAAYENRVRRERGLKPHDRSAKRLSDSTVKNAVKPVRACLSTAVDEGLIRHNPALRVPLPRRAELREGEEIEDSRALTREQLAAFLLVAHPDVRPRWQPKPPSFAELIASR